MKGGGSSYWFFDKYRVIWFPLEPYVYKTLMYTWPLPYNMSKQKTRKLANIDELNMLLYVCAAYGLAYASDKARKIGFDVPWTEGTESFVIDNQTEIREVLL